MTGKDLVRLAAAALLGAAIALPVGMMLGGDGSTTAPPRTAPSTAATRAVYSPKVLSDPYFLDEQRKGVKALEAHCRETGEMCAEARAGRQWLDERTAGQ